MNRAAWTRSAMGQDALLAVGLVALDLGGFWDRRTLATSDILGIVVVAYAVVGYVPLLWRRRAPVAVFGLMWAHSLLAMLVLPGYYPTLGVLQALYTVVAYRGGLAAVVVPILTLPLTALTVAQEVDRANPGQEVETLLVDAALYLALTAIAWAAGWRVALNRRRVRDLDRRRESEAREAVAAERARLACELHDIVAYTVTLMVLDSGAARKILPIDAEAADRALGQVTELGQQAMNELRRLLAVLRPDLGSNGAAAGQAPPGLDQLDEIVGRFRRTGLSIDVTTRGSPGELEPSIELAAVRVIQEGLTNVVRHVGADADVVLRLNWADELRVEIVDDGNGSRPALAASLSTGHGLLGLRERMAVAGGSLEASPTAAGGFRLAVGLPLRRVGLDGRPSYVRP
jgi:signal transduction histidine kinase